MAPLCIELPQGSQVIGDLHLDVDGESRAVDLAQFANFLEACSAPVLVILGDLFEYWLGPSHVSTPGGRALCERLRAFPGRVILIPGNRDVLAGSELEAFGVELAPSGVLATLPGGAKMLLLHGDELCIRDVNYQRLRRFLRNRGVNATLRYLPAFASRWIARRLRSHSEKATPRKAQLAVTQDADEARRRLAATGAGVLVAGHAHRFRDEGLGDGARLLILDAFGGERDLMRVGEQAVLECVSSSGVSS
jgi:UDP-2,3-diacylglucosamine hydrolase